LDPLILSPNFPWRSLLRKAHEKFWISPPRSGIGTTCGTLPTFRIRRLTGVEHVGVGIDDVGRGTPSGASQTGMAISTLHGGRDPSKPRPDRPDKPGERKRHVFTGRVTELLYDCFGAFEGFVIEDCERRHRFRACERGIEKVVRRACRHRSRISVVTASTALAKFDAPIRRRLLAHAEQAAQSDPVHAARATRTKACRSKCRPSGARRLPDTSGSSG
jgi:hypothetical protein